MSHVGSCFCGAVKLEVTGSPVAMGYCHCRSCRSWSGGPVNAFTLWKPEAVRVTAGAEHLATFQKTKLSRRQYCAKCGGHLMTNLPSPRSCLGPLNRKIQRCQVVMNFRSELISVAGFSCPQNVRKSPWVRQIELRGRPGKIRPD